MDPIEPTSVITANASSIKTWDMCVYVSGHLEGEVSDWPSHLQDPIYEAVERLSKKVKLPLAIVYSACEVEYGGAVDSSEDRPFVRVVVSEVVAKDERLNGLTPEQMKTFLDQTQSSA